MSENRKLADNAGSSNNNKSLNNREGMVPAEYVEEQENLARRPDSVQEDNTPGAVGSRSNNEYIEIFMHEYTGSDESIVEALSCVDFFSDFEGSGRVLRGRESERTGGNYSLCEFRNGKVYNCDLNASYNIGARYFIREIIKSLPATAGQQLEAKVPSAVKRSTCTLSTLISLHAVLAAAAA